MTSPEPPRSLAEVRARIDALDGRLIDLLAERERLVRAAAHFKPTEAAVHAPDRVTAVLTSTRTRALTAGLSPDVAEAVWRAMITAFIDLELRELRGTEA
ncbi:chorismate mutase [Streptomyces sp. NPDC060194]|uniref:chorismate mutase n=1 Tax=Streptomyces sp. NPDC060194 TaxID=3347069 RepID=UPI003668BBB4